MTFKPQEIKAVLFDYGNTLVPFGPDQLAFLYDCLAQTLTEMFGHCDREKLMAVRRNQIVKPDENGFKENDMREVSEAFIRGVYNLSPTEEQLDTVAEARYESFINATEPPDDLLPILANLGGRYRLGLLSNYPCGRTIRGSLDRSGITHIFEQIVVSGEVGWVKPHPKPFQVLLKAMELDPGECVYVGDNWLADVQGAGGVGMKSIYTKQFEPFMVFDQADDDYQPNYTINALQELADILLY